MERSKTLLVALLTVSAGAAAFFVAGSAFGQDWYEYKGRLTGGNAYLVAIPAGAEAFEIELVPNGDAAASTVALFDAKDTKVAVWKLDGAAAKGTYVMPAAGEHVLFVYTLSNGGLALRVSAEKASDEILSLKRLQTERQDVRVASVGEPAALSQKFATPALAKEPIFATLLYSGSVENLVASVASPKGEVLTVDGETGTAFGPGLYGDVAGSRTIHPENLAPGSYTATATADRFEGDLYLTFVRYVRGTAEIVGPGDAPEPEVPVDPAHPNAVEIPTGVPTAVQVPIGGSVLRFALQGYETPEEDEDDGDENSTFRGSKGEPWNAGPWSYGHGVPDAISVYTPDDRLLGVATFDETGVASIATMGPGEYVVLVRGSGRGMAPVLLEIPEIARKPVVRELGLTSETIEIGETELLRGGLEATFTLEKAPLLLGWRVADGRGFATMADGVFASDLGEAVRQHQPVAGGFSSWSDRVEVTWENLVEGEYTFTMNSLASHGKIVGIVFGYDRESGDEDEEHHQ